MSQVLTELNEGIFRITINPPDKLNALTESMITGIIQAIGQAQADPEAKVVVITGKGRGFSAGHDMKELQIKYSDRLQTEKKDIIPVPRGALPTALYKFDKPTIAAVNGPCIGMGMDIAIACDFRIVSKDATFGETYVQRSLVPSGSVFYLPRLIGLAKAYEILLLGEIFSAEKADQMGLVTKLVEPDQLESEANQLATKLASGYTIAQRLTKQVIRRSLESNFLEMLEFVGYARSVLSKTRLVEEGVQQFYDKREPDSSGKH